MPLRRQISLTGQLLRGLLHYPIFDQKGYVLAGPGLRIRKRFGKIYLGRIVGFGPEVGISVVGQDATRKAVLEIGAGTHIRARTHINCQERVSIGEHCGISWDVEILDTDFHGVVGLDGTERPRQAPVMIGDRVWIGTRSIVLKGVTIGHDSIVAAGSVVTRSIPPHSLCAGNPAVVVKEVRGWRN